MAQLLELTTMDRKNHDGDGGDNNESDYVTEVNVAPHDINIVITSDSEDGGSRSQLPSIATTETVTFTSNKEMCTRRNKMHKVPCTENVSVQRHLPMECDESLAASRISLTTTARMNAKTSVSLFPGRRPGARGNRSSAGIFSTRAPPSQEEVTFLEAAEYGNIPTVRKMLEESTTFSVNCVDFMGQNALQLAVGNEHLEVVEVLLKQPAMARIGDALLLAISKGYVRIAEIILNHPSFQVHDRLTRSPCEQKLMNQGFLKHSSSARAVPEKSGDEDSTIKDTDFYGYDEDGTRFSPDITPIILAAQCQEYEIVHELLARGAKIQKPHNYQCTCEDCVFRKKLDSFSYSLSRINAYKGLASPAYLSLSSSDPVLTALELSHELQLLAEIEKEFKKEYRDLATQCNDFAEKLLDLCHDTLEVGMILNGDEESGVGVGTYSDAKTEVTTPESYPGPNGFSKPTSESYSERKYPYATGLNPRPQSMPQLKRLKTAIRYGAKGFVAHPNCQQQLLRLWQRNLTWLWQGKVYNKFFFAAAVTVFMPIAALTYILAPCTKAGMLVKSPFFKFISHAMSYFQFLVLLVVNSSDRFEGGFLPTWFLVHQTKPEGRYTTFTWCEVLIMLYVLGFLWNECHEVFDEGPKEYMFKLWNIIDFFMLSIFLASYALRAFSYYRVNQAQMWWDTEFGENVSRLYYSYPNSTLYLNGTIHPYNVSDQNGYYAYNNADRKYWEGTDPQLLSEALFSFAIVLSFSRIAYILPANEMFGPLQISLGRTVADIMKWVVIFMLIFGAFMLGLFNLYSYYSAEGAKHSKSFTSLEETFIALFWSMFGLADYKGVEVNYTHPYTRLVGYQLYGAYNIISVIIMLNMLIAMINSSYSDVEKDADVEWKFARSKLWLSYFDEGKTLPVPYNLLPSPKSVLALSRKILGICSFLRAICCCVKTRKRSDSRQYNCWNARIAKRQLVREKPSSDPKSSAPAGNGDQRTMKRADTTVSGSFSRWKELGTRKRMDEPSKYQQVMRKIVKRFVIMAQAEKARDEVNEGELLEIKHDISSLRFELLENNALYGEELRKINALLQKSVQAGFRTDAKNEEPSRSPSEHATPQKIFEKSASTGDFPSPRQYRKKKALHTLWRRPPGAEPDSEQPQASANTPLPSAAPSQSNSPEHAAPSGTDSWMYADAGPVDDSRRRQRKSAYVAPKQVIRKQSPSFP